jgi:hypothetical protein
VSTAELEADARTARTLGINPRAEYAAHNVLILARLVRELQERGDALGRRIEQLEAERPKSLPGRALTSLARIFP